VVGCGLVTANRNRDALLSLQVGMSRDEVINMMGQPSKREAYGSTEYLLYKTDTTGQSERADFTPVAITNGKVVGWGRNYYENAVRSKIDADITVKQR
jgi:outer membrane protein assembly factor BamE (lipoprotein component of BamABCDE complex)